MKHSIRRPLCKCQGLIDEDTRSQIQALEQVQDILDEAKSSATHQFFQSTLDDSLQGLFNLCEQHWQKGDRLALQPLGDVLQRWMEKYKPHGRLMAQYYLCRAILAEEAHESLDFLERAKWLSEDEIFGSKQLLVKIHVVKGDLMVTYNPEKAIKSYNKALMVCQKNPLMFGSSEDSSWLKELMVEANYKLAMTTKNIEGVSKSALEYLNEAIKFGGEMEGKNSPLVSRLQEAYKTMERRLLQSQRFQQHMQQYQPQEPILVKQKQIHCGEGIHRRPYHLRIIYLQGQQKLQILLEDKTNYQLLTKSVKVALEDMEQVENLGKHVDSWLTVDKNLKIMVNEENVGKVCEGQPPTPIPKDKGLVLKLIKNHEIYKSTNFGSESSDDLPEEPGHQSHKQSSDLG